MTDFKQRLVTEKAELDEKLNKLTLFIGSKTYCELEIGSRIMLSRQHTVMGEYSRILGERLADLAQIT